MSQGGPNVVVLTVDALRPDYLSESLCPTLMDLIGDGVYFRQAFASINTTEPSLTSFYTGDYPRTTGLIRHGGGVTEPELRALRDTTFLQERLQQQGYTTTAVDWIGDYHQRGYDHYSGELVESIPSAKRDGDSDGPGVKNRLFELLETSLSPETFNRLRKIKHATLGPKNPAGGWLPDSASAVVNHAVKRVEDSPEPFYLFCHFWDTHAPYEVPDEYLGGFDASDPEDRLPGCYFLRGRADQATPSSNRKQGRRRRHARDRDGRSRGELRGARHLLRPPRAVRHVDPRSDRAPPPRPPLWEASQRLRPAR